MRLFISQNTRFTIKDRYQAKVAKHMDKQNQRPTLEHLIIWN
jgi:hypothetical protein